MATTIQEWKNYLKSMNLYNGDLTLPTIDDDFKNAMINLELNLSNDVPSIKNLIWQNNKPNPNISIDDYKNALQLLTIKKQKKSIAQVGLDTLGPPPSRDEIPLAVKFQKTDDDSKLNNGDPDTSQHNGVLVNKMPAKQEQKPIIQKQKTNNSVNKRMHELEKLLTD